MSCQTRAVDAGLLTGTNADDSTTIGVSDTVRLSVLQSQSGDDEVGERLVRKLSEAK